jgi:hypothetical protein
MSDTPNTPASPEPLPTDEPTAAEMAAAGAIRPLEQLPSPWTVKGNPKAISEPTLSGLSPADQQTVMERAGSTDPKAVNAALMDFLKERQREFRIKCGAGEGATATEREALSQLNQVRLLSTEFHRLEDELAEVSGYRTKYDDQDNPVPVPIHLHQGDSRSAKQHRMVEIKRQLALLAGHEGEAALRQAARSDVLKTRDINRQLSDHREVERRAHEMAREDRINAAARQKAKLYGGSHG